MRFIFRAPCNITIHNLIRSIIFPVGRMIIISHHSPYPFGINISVRIFPTFLQKQNSCRIIFSGHIRNLTETGSTDTILPVRHLHFIIKLKCHRFFSKRHATLQHLLWILSTLNRFMHRPCKNRTCRQHSDINKPQHFHTFHACIQTCTIPFSPFFRENRRICFCNSRYLCHYIRSTPR